MNGLWNSSRTWLCRQSLFRNLLPDYRDPFSLQERAGSPPRLRGSSSNRVLLWLPGTWRARLAGQHARRGGSRNPQSPSPAGTTACRPRQGLGRTAHSGTAILGPPGKSPAPESSLGHCCHDQQFWSWRCDSQAPGLSHTGASVSSHGSRAPIAVSLAGLVVSMDPARYPDTVDFAWRAGIPLPCAGCERTGRLPPVRR